MYYLEAHSWHRGLLISLSSPKEDHRENNNRSSALHPGILFLLNNALKRTGKTPTT